MEVLMFTAKHSKEGDSKIKVRKDINN